MESDAYTHTYGNNAHTRIVRFVLWFSHECDYRFCSALWEILHRLLSATNFNRSMRATRQRREMPIQMKRKRNLAHYCSMHVRNGRSEEAAPEHTQKTNARTKTVTFARTGPMRCSTHVPCVHWRMWIAYELVKSTESPNARSTMKCVRFANCCESAKFERMQ